MQVITTLIFLVTCELCLTIRVPVIWDASASEVKQEIRKDNDEQLSEDSFKPQNDQILKETQDEQPIPKEYFQYTAKKPQFTINIAKFHGVQSPENHYKAYPIKPYTVRAKPELGKHQLFDKEREIHRPLQEFANINEGGVSHAVPVSSNYEVFHPYETETPALQEIYKDPILTKIRNDLENSKNRLQAYEKETGQPDIHKEEYLESPEKTDSRFVQHRNIPAPYEIHRPQRRPIYYRPVSKNHHREQFLNQRLRHPWNQYSAKIRPMHYRPVKNHIHNLRQNHALKYDDERNEYPQVQILEHFSSDPKDGYDIYEKGKDKFVELRNNFDESINKAVEKTQPTTYQKLEMQNNDYAHDYDDDNEEEFVPIKNYAQVRKTETFKHLPRSAALADAESFDELRNAPRLREAVKSTKAQTVYSEEGYEDSAYDHAGEQKHASENEGHGGFLKEHELSSGKYKTPSENINHEDGGGSAYRDQTIHAEKWLDQNKDNKEETDEEDYSEDELEKSVDADGYRSSIAEDENYRNKREDDSKNNTYVKSVIQNNNKNESNIQHDVAKRNANFVVPELDLTSTFLTEREILEVAKIKVEPNKDDIVQKYPYYFKNFKTISKHSPLRYAEDLKLIPKKSNGGTEFYDSRSQYQCPEVDDVPDPVPDKLKGDGNPDDEEEARENSSEKGDENYDTAQKTPRLKGLGDKIDCFKAKYFGKNPLDSPFFKEEIISNPEPVTRPNLTAYKLKVSLDNEQHNAESNINSELTVPVGHKEEIEPSIFDVLEKLRSERNNLRHLPKSNEELLTSSFEDQNTSNTDNINLRQQVNMYSDIMDSIQSEIKSTKNKVNLKNATEIPIMDSVTNSFFKHMEEITQLPPKLRKKRSVSFVYEPYKIIRDSQIQDSKKTTTTSNIGPLIRQLQSSRVVDRLPKPTQEIEQSEKHVKRNVNSRIYKNIDRNDRETNGSKNDKSSVEPTFVDISVDSRRGEPRYEIRHNNHKMTYKPVENKKSMSIEDYKAQTGEDTPDKKYPKGETGIQRRSRQRNMTAKLSPDTNIQNIAASSNTIRKTISTTTVKPKNQKPKTDDKQNENLSEEDYEEYDDEEEEEKSAVITTTTQKPSFRRRIKLSTSTEKSTEKPKLKLVTRFRDYSPGESSETFDEYPEYRNTRNDKIKIVQTNKSNESIPKYREKKKMSSKSTIVTDTKKYGDDDDDMRKEEVDALVGVKQDMTEYMPLYEKEENKLSRKPQNKNINEHNDEEGDKNDRKFNSDDDNADKDIDDDERIENDDDDNNDDTEDEEEDDDDDDDDEYDDVDDEEEESEPEIQITTPEPTKRTLPLTTDAPIPTTAFRKVKPEIKPIITRKKIEIHTELPVNKSAPHVTQFKQDIKEVEIVKEIPSAPKRKIEKNLEALELYKDDNLAKDVNKLGGVEVFKKDIDLKNGPRHGGNYRSLVEPNNAAPLKEARNKVTKEDAETSESEFTKHIELDEKVPNNKMHGGNLRSLSDYRKNTNRGRSSKLIELRDTPITSMHGGNLKRGRARNTNKSQKLIELDDDDTDQNNDDPSSDHESFSNSRNSRPMHGGNYRRAKLVAEEKPEVTEQPIRNEAKSARRTSAAILNSFVQAAPILTTTPAYILDPSKRMYYYVDA